MKLKKHLKKRNRSNKRNTGPEEDQKVNKTRRKRNTRMKKNEGKQWPNENKHLKEKRNTGRKETIKGKETPVLEGKTPEGERHFFMYCTVQHPA